MDIFFGRYVHKWHTYWRITPPHYGDCPFEGRPMELYQKFQDHIPADKVKESKLWNEMVETQMESIISEIIG